MIRVLAADDSAVMRSLLTRMFAVSAECSGQQTQMELCAAVADGAACLQAARSLRPDVVLMDLHMPGLEGGEAGGLETIEQLHREQPELPIVMCSAYTADGAEETLEGLARGAADYVTKPVGGRDAGAAMASLWTQLGPKIEALVGAARRVRASSQQATHRERLEPCFLQRTVVAIGVSTGGPAALERLLPRLPANFAASILVVQHMPKLFTAALAERLDGCCGLRVRMALPGTMLQPGTIWMAPGDSHMMVKAGVFGKAQLGLHRGVLVNDCRPSVDVLFRSVAETFRARALGVVLTGMGSDGLEGARAIVDAGGLVLAQDEASSAVWGMPGRVVEAGLARAALPLEALAEELIVLTKTGGDAAKARMHAQPLERPEAARGAA